MVANACPLSNFKYLFNSLFRVLFIVPSRYVVRYRSPIAYLALDELYHPLRIAFLSYPTRGTGVVDAAGPKPGPKNGILTLFDAFFQRTYKPGGI